MVFATENGSLAFILLKSDFIVFFSINRADASLACCGGDSGGIFMRCNYIDHRVE